MAERRRVLESSDIELIIGNIRGFRKKPTWNAIVAKATIKGLPFKLRAIQRQPLIKTAYDAEVADIRSRQENRVVRCTKVGRPRSKMDTKDLLLKYESRIAELTRQNVKLAEQLHWLRQCCRRENTEVADISRPLAFPGRGEQN